VGRGFLRLSDQTRRFNKILLVNLFNRHFLPIKLFRVYHFLLKLRNQLQLKLYQISLVCCSITSVSPWMFWVASSWSTLSGAGLLGQSRCILIWRGIMCSNIDTTCVLCKCHYTIGYSNLTTCLFCHSKFFAFNIEKKWNFSSSIISNRFLHNPNQAYQISISKKKNSIFGELLKSIFMHYFT